MRGRLTVLGLWLAAKVTTALMPPHPDYTSWESVHAMRRRLNVTFGYEPVHVSHEHCRYLSEDQCRKDDEGLGHAKAGGGVNGRRLGPSIGDNVRVLVLLVRFSDHATRTLPQRDYFETLFNSDGVSDMNTVGSIKEYLRYSSMGKYRVQYDVRDWLTLANTEAYYSSGTSGVVGSSNIQEMFTEALNAVQAAGVDWYNGYISDWGMINHVTFLTSGYAAEFGPIQCAPNETPEMRIWSQGIATFDNGWLSTDSLQMNSFAISSALGQPSCDANGVTAKPAGMAIITHEFLHGFGLFDLYDQDPDDASIVIAGTAKFDIMSNAYGWDRNSSMPGHMSPFSRMKVEGWLEPITITEDGMYAVQASEISSQVYKISHNFPEGEYLLIENRQAVKWDKNWPHSGIVIYHVDEKAPQQTRRGYPGKAGWPADHYSVSVIQADGLYDIELGVNLGDAGDFWTKDDVLRPGPTFPNTDSIQGGVQKPTGVSISIRSNPGFIMAFQVSGIAGGKAPLMRNQTSVRDSKTLRRSDPNSTGHVLAWMLALLGGAAAMVGVLVVLF